MTPQEFEDKIQSIKDKFSTDIKALRDEFSKPEKKSWFVDGVKYWFIGSTDFIGGKINNENSDDIKYLSYNAFKSQADAELAREYRKAHAKFMISGNEFRINLTDEYRKMMKETFGNQQ